MRTPFSTLQRSARFAASLFFLASFAIVLLSGCRGHSRISDPRLQKIADILDAQLPEGTSRARVEFFLHSRGYETLSSSDGKTLTAMINRVDEETLQPVTARVVFTFDEHDKLKSYEITMAAMNP